MFVGPGRKGDVEALFAGMFHQFELLKEQGWNIAGLRQIGDVFPFEKYDIRNSEKDYTEFCKSSLRDKAMHELGVGTTRDMHSVISGIFLPSLKCKTYTQKERINLWKGKIASAKYQANKDAHFFNAKESVPKIDIPIYFITGEYDYTCSALLQKEYFEFIDAPQKKMYIFENSAHSPIYEKHDKAKHVLSEIKTLTSEKIQSNIN